MKPEALQGLGLKLTNVHASLVQTERRINDARLVLTGQRRFLNTGQ